MKAGDRVIVSFKDFESEGVILYIRPKKCRGDCNIMVKTEKLYGTELANPTDNVPCQENELTLCK